jgi:Mg2+ and Co2+ transporter CorA
MNVGGLPGVDSQLGFAGSVVVMVAVAVGLIAFFRGRKWL